jgi:hypothetical protein
MKALIDRAAESGETFKVEKYFFTFMKFISSIVPTLQLEQTSLDNLFFFNQFLLSVSSES